MRNVRSCLAILMLIAAAMPAPGRASSPGPSIDPGILQAAEPQVVMARFDEAVPVLDGIDGLTVTYRFTSIPAVAATVTPPAARALARHPSLVRLEADLPVEFDLDTATIVSRAKEVWGGDDPVMVGGRIVDGAGIGIAIVDTGLDGTHPDFAERVAGNYQVTPAGPVPVGPWSAHPYFTDGAHGTHVAGIAAGSGAASDGKFRGVASGSSLYGFNMYQGSLVFGTIAFDWILANGARQNPPIRVVNNSWHCVPAACFEGVNGQRMHMELASKLAEAGIVVTWAAGNLPGDGDISTVNVESTNPTPGIIGVSNYKDRLGSVDTGRRDLCLSSTTSWGSSHDPTTWPDLSAPGRSIMSTYAIGPYASSLGTRTGRNPVTGADTYREMTGTSMAAPHIAGIAALMLQANPALTPADIEYILKQTSTPLVGPPSEDPSCGLGYVRADPTHPWHASNYAAGHGLADARAAVDAAIGFTGIPARIDNEPIPDDFIVMRPGIRAQRTLYFTGDDTMSETYPDADTPRVRAFDRNGSVSHTSAPLGSESTVDALEVHAYIGSTAEANDLGGSRMGYVDYLADVWRVPATGAPELLAHGEVPNHHRYRTLMPNQRRFRLFLDDPVVLAASDRIRVDLVVFLRVPWPANSGEDGTNQYWNMWTESFTPSRVVLGTTVPRPHPESREGCERVTDCAMVDATHPFEGVWCDSTGVMRLRWRGPAGSALNFTCNGVTFSCPVYGEPGSVGTCERDVPLQSQWGDRAALCFYRMPDGSRGGDGKCWAITPTEDA